MLRAVSKESIRAEDFQRSLTMPPPAFVERKASVGVSSNQNQGTVGGIHVSVPSIADIADDEDEADESGKIQPINLGQLKDYMQKRMQKVMGKKPPKLGGGGQGHQQQQQQQLGSPDKEDGIRSPTPA
jgi:hypothetical protein